MPKKTTLSNHHIDYWLNYLEGATNENSVALYKFLVAEKKRREKAGEKGGRPIQNKTKRAEQIRKASAKYRESLKKKETPKIIEKEIPPKSEPIEVEEVETETKKSKNVDFNVDWGA